MDINNENINNNENNNENINSEKPHKRRVRYKGTHPRTYAEKYKEHNPEKYKDTIEKVISKGSTPAGMHISICVKEILEFLDINRDRLVWMPHLDMVDILYRCLRS